MSDLIIQFNNFEPEMDLPEDICGSRMNSSIEQPPETGLPENFWFQNPSGTSLVTNNELPGKADNRFSDTIRSNENRQVINKVHIMAMRDEPALELERALKLSFSQDDFRNSSFLRYNLFLLPMIGPIFWECWPYKTEEDAKIELRRRKGIKPVFARECSKCGSCRFKNSLPPKNMFCSKLGLELFLIDFTTPPPRNIISHLRIAGLLTVTKPEYSWDDVRAAVIFPQKNDRIRVYEQYAAPRQVLPGAQYRKGLLALNKLNYDKQQQREIDEKEKVTQTIYYPIIQKTQEAILRNRQNDVVAQDLIRKIILPPTQTAECKQLIESLAQDILLWACLRILLPVYKTCGEIHQFLRRKNIHIPNAVMRNECTSCVDYKNGLCQKLECRLVTYAEQIPEADRLRAIENIGNENSIDWNLINYCKKLETSEMFSGLSKLREILNTPQVLPKYSGAGLQDLDTLPVKNIDSETTEGWIIKKLRDTSIIKIETDVINKFGRKKGMAMIQDALWVQKIHPSDMNELCLTDYQINTELNIPRLQRCGFCSNATMLYCKKYNKAFVSEMNKVPAEVNEILGFFEDVPLSVEIDQKRKHQVIDIVMENPGDSMFLDVKVEKPLNEQKLWYEAQRQQLEVETPDAVEFDSPLDVVLGEPGEGMVLGEDLL